MRSTQINTLFKKLSKKAAAVCASALLMLLLVPSSRSFAANPCLSSAIQEALVKLRSIALTEPLSSELKKARGYLDRASQLASIRVAPLFAAVSKPTKKIAGKEITVTGRELNSAFDDAIKDVKSQVNRYLENLAQAIEVLDKEGVETGIGTTGLSASEVRAILVRITEVGTSWIRKKLSDSGYFQQIVNRNPTIEHLALDLLELYIAEHGAAVRPNFGTRLRELRLSLSKELTIEQGTLRLRKMKDWLTDRTTKNLYGAILSATLTGYLVHNVFVDPNEKKKREQRNADRDHWPKLKERLESVYKKIVQINGDLEQEFIKTTDPTSIKNIWTRTEPHYAGLGTEIDDILNSNHTLRSLVVEQLNVKLITAQDDLRKARLELGQPAGIALERAETKYAYAIADRRALELMAPGVSKALPTFASDFENNMSKLSSYKPYIEAFLEISHEFSGYLQLVIQTMDRKYAEQ